MIRKGFITFLMLFVSTVLFAQFPMKDLSKVKVDNMSDRQVKQFVSKFKSSGKSVEDIEQYAKANGMSATEFEKLRRRIEDIEQKSASNSAEEATVSVQRESLENVTREPASPKSNVYGSDLFSNSKMSFEPNMNMATPRNYQIGPGDELIIDVYGYSENTMKLTVSSEGMIRIPNVGQVQVNGITIENAEKKIKKRLESVYSTISSGKTTVSLSLGNIRSIKVYISGQVARPGTYTLSSLSTVYNALYACGGPSGSGSMRNIKVVRNGKEIATVDLYSFLINGVLENNITLNDQDVIQVPPYDSRVLVDGAVKIRGAFEMKPNETLKDLFRFAGGFKENAYKNRVSVTRNTEKQKSVADVAEELYGMFVPQSGDVYVVDTILSKYTNRVQIYGSVFRPGAYALDEGMTLRDLVAKADGLKEDAYLERATVARLRDDLTPELVSFNVEDLLSGKFNVELKKEDVVTIGSKHELEEAKNVSIYGQVLSPGVYPYYENMTLKDLIFLAKGFKEFAECDKIEVSRRRSDGMSSNADEKMEIISISVDRELSRGDGAEFVLQPKDQVSVRMREGIEGVKYMDVLGEVRSPGNYVIISKTERVSDIMLRAGGLTSYAYPKGAFLIRKSNRTTAERMRDMKLIEKMSELAENSAERKEMEASLLSRTDLVGIDMVEILKNPGSKIDPFVENGDVVFIPKKLQTVTVSGSVQVPGMMIYDRHKLRKYISGAGGFADNADKKRLYVAYPNGEIKTTSRFLWIKNYPEVEPGSHIFVPEKPHKETNTKENITFMTSVLGSLVSIASVVVSVILISK